MSEPAPEDKAPPKPGPRPPSYHFAVAFGVCAGLPLVGGILMRTKTVLGGFGSNLALASLLAWFAFFVIGIAAMARGDRSRGDSYVAGAIIGAIVGFGSCLAVSSR